jgi:abortive infection bacteriophage resistance protein
MEAIGIGKDFLSKTQVAEQLKERINTRDYMRLKGFCTTKEMVSKLKKPPTKWEKIFASYTSDKGLITRIYGKLKKLNSNPTYSGAGDQQDYHFLPRQKS